MKMKKIYIAGCGGMLGEAFYEIFSNLYDLKCTDIDNNEILNVIPKPLIKNSRLF